MAVDRSSSYSTMVQPRDSYGRHSRDTRGPSVRDLRLIKLAKRRSDPKTVPEVSEIKDFGVDKGTEEDEAEFRLFCDALLRDSGDREEMQEEVRIIVQELLAEGLQVQPHGSTVSGLVCKSSDVDVATSSPLQNVKDANFFKFELDHLVWRNSQIMLEAVVLKHIRTGRYVHVISNKDPKFYTSYAFGRLMRDMAAEDPKAADMIRMAKTWWHSLGMPKFQKRNRYTAFVITLISAFALQRRAFNLMPKIEIAPVFEPVPEQPEDEASAESMLPKKGNKSMPEKAPQPKEIPGMLKYTLKAVPDRVKKRNADLAMADLMKEFLSFVRDILPTTVIDLRPIGSGGRIKTSNNSQVILEPFSGDQVVAVTATLEHDFVCDKATETLGMIFGFPAVQQHPLANFEMAFLRPPPEGAIENAEEAEAIENAEEAEDKEDKRSTNSDLKEVNINEIPARRISINSAK
jgi:hypothetical protein